MYTNPKEDRTHIDPVLMEQFLRKGYKCEEIREDDATIFVITFEKKYNEVITQLTSETYKELLRAN